MSGIEFLKTVQISFARRSSPNKMEVSQCRKTNKIFEIYFMLSFQYILGYFICWCPNAYSRGACIRLYWTSWIQVIIYVNRFNCPFIFENALYKGFLNM